MKRTASSSILFMLLGTSLLLVGLLGAPGIGVIPLAATTGLSWNSHVACTPTVASVSQIFTGWDPITGGEIVPGTTIAPVNQFYSTFSDQGKKALTAPYPDPPPCTGPTVGTGTAIAPNGPAASTFVEVDGLKVDTTSGIQDNAAGGDCSTTFAPYNVLNGVTSMGGSYCDAYGNLDDPAYTAGCESTNSQHHLCLRVHIDNNWKGAMFCGPSVTACNNSTLDQANDHVTLLDVQGFLWFNNGAPPTGGRAFSVWELHPLTAVRFHVAPPTMSTTFVWSPQVSVAGQTTVFSSSVTGGTAPYSYTWNFGDGTTAGPGPSSSITKGYGTAGVYTASLTVTDSSPVKLTATATNPITVVNPTPALSASFTATPQTATVGTTIAFSATIAGGTMPYTVSWGFGDGFVGSGTTSTHAYAAPGSYTVTLTVTDSSNPAKSTSNTGTVQIQQPPPSQLVASLTWSPTIAIAGRQVSFSVTASGGTAPYTYSWNFGAGGGSTPLDASPTYTYGNAGKYNVTVTVLDSGNQQTSVLSTIVVQPAPCSYCGGGGGTTVTLPPTWLILAGSGAGLLAVGFVFALRRRPRTGSV